MKWQSAVTQRARFALLQDALLALSFRLIAQAALWVAYAALAITGKDLARQRPSRLQNLACMASLLWVTNVALG